MLFLMCLWACIKNCLWICGCCLTTRFTNSDLFFSENPHLSRPSSPSNPLSSTPISVFCWCSGEFHLVWRLSCYYLTHTHTPPSTLIFLSPIIPSYHLFRPSITLSSSGHSKSLACTPLSSRRRICSVASLQIEDKYIEFSQNEIAN